MLKIEKGIFWTTRAGEHRREGGAGEQGREHDQHHPGADVGRQEAVHRDRRRVAGEHEAEGDLDPGEGGAQDPEPGERRERRLGRLQDDAGGDRPGGQLARACRRACRSSRRPGSRAGRGRRRAGATPPTQATIRASRRGSERLSDCLRAGWSRTSSSRTPPPTSTRPSSERADDEDRALALVDRHRPAEPSRRGRSRPSPVASSSAIPASSTKQRARIVPASSSIQAQA